MNKMYILLLSILLISFVSATPFCQMIYDDFSLETLDTNRWEIRQDLEGQPLMDEFWVDSKLQNFHTQQNITGDKRVYLVPKHNFTTGDILEYDFNVISKENNYMQMDLLTGDQYIRLGIMGYINGVQGYDELGVSHVKIEFQENNLHLIRTSPSGLNLTDNIPLTKNNGTYELYIGSISGDNGRVHIDYDEFILNCPIPSSEGSGGGGSIFDEIERLEEKIDNLTTRVTLLETLIDKIKSWFWFMPYSIKKEILCATLKETSEKKITEWNVACEMKKQKKNNICVCKKV